MRDLDPTLPVYDIRTLSDHVEKNLVLRRIPARMFVVLGPALLILAAIGIYAVVAYAVSLRTKEIGLRLALGATNGRVVSQIVTESLRVVFVGGIRRVDGGARVQQPPAERTGLPLGVRRRAGAAPRRRRAGLLAAGAARGDARSDRGAATGVTAARWIGLDFGTTNSAVALVDASGPPRLALFPTAAGPRPTFPSVLYFEPERPAAPAVRRRARDRRRSSGISRPSTRAASSSRSRRTWRTGRSRARRSDRHTTHSRSSSRSSRGRWARRSTSRRGRLRGASSSGVRCISRIRPMPSSIASPPNVCWRRSASPASKRSSSSSSRSPPPMRTKRGSIATSGS